MFASAVRMAGHVRIGIAAALVLGALAASPVLASVTSYATRGEWNAAVGPRATIDFEGIAAPGSYINIVVPQGLTQQGVNFATARPTTGDDFILAGPGSYGPSSVLAMYDLTEPRTLVISFPGSASSAIALDLRTTGDPRTVDIQLSTGERFPVTVGGAPTFVGFASTIPITRVSVTEPHGTNTLLLDDVSFAAAAPEPSAPIQGVPTLTDSLLLLLAAAVVLIARYGTTRH